MGNVDDRSRLDDNHGVCRLLRRVPILLLLFLGTSVASAQVAGPGELSRKDRLRALYSGRLFFTHSQEPMITLRVTDGVASLEMSFKKGIVLLPQGPEGARLRVGGAGSIEVRLEEARSGEESWRVRLDKLAARRLGEIVRKRAWWSKQGFKVETVEIGTVFGFHGNILDNREVLLVVHAKKRDHASAKALAARIHDNTGREVRVESWLQTLPAGRIVLRIPGRDLELRADDLLWLQVPEGSRLEVARVRFGGSGGGNARGTENRVLSGLLYLTIDPRGRLAFGQAVGAEKLLRGIVPAEIYASAPQAALRAQAITARGDLLAKLGKRHHDEPFLLCNEVHCQAYRGTGREDPRTTRAVNETRGRVLFKDDALVPAVYHSSCGGHTDANEYIWPGSAAHPALRPVVDRPGASGAESSPVAPSGVEAFLDRSADAFCGRPKSGRAAFRWTLRRSAAELRRSLDPNGALGTLTEVRVLRRSPGGRAVELLVRGAKGRRTLHSELSIRRALGGLRSALFALHPDRDGEGGLRSLKIVGGGFGHGVGMCQHGAMGMATLGHDTAEILKHYYRGAEIRRIY